MPLAISGATASNKSTTQKFYWVAVFDNANLPGRYHILETQKVFFIPSNELLVSSSDRHRSHATVDCLNSIKLKSTKSQQSERGGNTTNMVCKGTTHSCAPSINRQNSFRDKLSKFKDVSFRRHMNNPSISRLDSSSDLMGASMNGSDDNRKPKVRFVKRICNKVYEIERPEESQKSSIWWTLDELNASRSDGHVTAMTDSSIQKYVSAFEQAKRQVHTCRKLSSDALKDLVKGLAKGYLGLETMSNNTKRIESIRDHVVSVVKFYRDQSKSNNPVGLNDSFHSVNSHTSTSTNHTNNVIRDQAVRNFAAKLSAGNRHFASAMGNAEHLAATRDRQLDSLTCIEENIESHDRAPRRQSSMY
jgi:hypothetical protein